MALDHHTFHELLTAAPLVAILRGMEPKKTADTAAALWAAGVSLVEIPLHSPTSHDAFLETLQAKTDHPDATLGIGSVRSKDDYRNARDSGADFTVSPGLFPDVCEESLTDNIAHLPGVFTPTELGQALALGFTTVKLFPASTFGPAGLKALRDPYPEAHIVAVGGINHTNAIDYLSQGAIAVGMGSALTSSAIDPAQLLATLTTHH